MNSRYWFWSLLALSFMLIIVIKFSPLKDIHTSQVSYLSWFHYGSELGETIFGLSLSYIVSCIFYFVVVYLPEERKRKATMLVIEKRIDAIIGEMGVLIHYLFHKNNVTVFNEDTSNLKQQVESITKIDLEKKPNFSYQYIEKETNRTVPFHTGAYTELMLFNHTNKNIKAYIKSIFEIPAINNIDHDLLIILEKINNSTFLRTVSFSDEIIPIILNHNLETPELGKSLYKFYTLYQQLSTFIEPTEYTFKQ